MGAPPAGCHGRHAAAGWIKKIQLRPASCRPGFELHGLQPDIEFVAARSQKLDKASLAAAVGSEQRGAPVGGQGQEFAP
jgi:hypothetical protein